MSKNIAASVHQRLLNLARSRGSRFNDLLQRYALERWIYRLSISDHADHFVLKGALMLSAWNLPVTRPTKDIDMLASAENDLDAIQGLLVDICQVTVEDDGLLFDGGSMTTYRIVKDALYQGTRSVFDGSLGNARIAMQIDLGFSDVITPEAVFIIYPTILDQPAPKLKAYNKETAIAEKFEAMAKLGELNSRMKDFFDIWSLATSQRFESAIMSEAIAQTFANRCTPRSPDSICFTNEFGHAPEKQKQWQAFVRRSQLTGEVPKQFVDVWRLVMDFLYPMLRPEPGSLRWPACGPWEPK